MQGHAGQHVSTSYQAGFTQLITLNIGLFEPFGKDTVQGHRASKAVAHHGGLGYSP